MRQYGCRRLGSFGTGSVIGSVPAQTRAAPSDGLADHACNSPEAAPHMVQAIMPAAAQPLGSLAAETTQHAEGIVAPWLVTRR